MSLKELVDALGLEVVAGGSLEHRVRGCYVSDLLSDVLANSREGNLWVTRQTHPNIVAVAAIKGLSAVVITGGRSIEEETLQKARSEGVVLLRSPKDTFELAGALYAMLKEEARKEP
jgi:predicted transcriptional regulator